MERGNGNWWDCFQCSLIIWIIYMILIFSIKSWTYWKKYMGILKKTTSGEVELWWGGGWARHLPGQPRIPEHNVDDFHDGGDGSYGQVVVMVVMMVMVIMTRCDPIYWTFWGKTWSNCAEGPAGQLPLDSEQKGFSLKHAVPFFIFRVEISDNCVSRLGGGVTSISDDIFYRTQVRS